MPDAAPTSTDHVMQAIVGAIAERRLMPGTKLVEQQIADAFQVSRTVVRQALHQLARNKVVRLLPARGASVACPDADEARQVFEVRRVLEAALAEQLAGRLGPAQVQQLRAHLRQEAAAIRRTDVPGRTRLLADFHTLLARLLGNQVLADTLHDLLLRSSLVALMVQSAHSAEASHAEHVAIVDALVRGDGALARERMLRHLDMVASDLQRHPGTPALADALLAARPGGAAGAAGPVAGASGPVSAAPSPSPTRRPRRPAGARQPSEPAPP